MTDGSLKFDWQYIGDLLAGEKDSTVRYDDDGDIEQIEVGDRLTLADPDGDAFAEADVVTKAPTPAKGCLETIIAHGHQHGGEFGTEIVAALNRFYDEDIGYDTEVVVIGFGDVEKAYGGR